MKIWEYLDLYKLTEAISADLVHSSRHQTLPLQILTYTRKTVYEDVWNEITTRCRGLIVSDDGDIISRPFEKFFNVSTQSRPETWVSNLPLESPLVLDKIDGSLGILYTYQMAEGVSVTGIASKGSFHSPHAVWATNWYHQHCKNARWPDGYTPVFEMICQGVQHHVVHYPVTDHLILIALINNETGEEADYSTLYNYARFNGVGVPDVYLKSLGDVLEEDRVNAEGYVLSWPRPGTTPLKVKFKYPKFLALQKVVHAATPRNILEALADGNNDVLTQWASVANPEIRAFVTGWITLLREEYCRILTEASAIVKRSLMVCTTRKESAAYFLSKENDGYAAICFALISDKDYRRSVWKLVAPLTARHGPVFDDVDDDGELE